MAIVPGMRFASSGLRLLIEKKVPFLFPAAAHKRYPWVMGWVPSFRFEGHISSLQDHVTLYRLSGAA